MRSRIDAVGAFHHIMVRGIEQEKLFENDWETMAKKWDWPY
jgi:hypothetical protein